ncbi:MAG: hypothetical protein LBK94_12160 [Prevotellaceae bacterium]|jgi:hypothetical protein|nr:hypothetical protein [Prevotellaceae bacterium]
MKKILIILVAVIGFVFAANAGQWKVSVYISEYHEYFSLDGNFQFSEANGGQSQTISVTANNEQDAKSKANAECQKICRAKDYIGTKTVNGVQYKVYRVQHSTTHGAWEVE